MLILAVSSNVSLAQKRKARAKQPATPVFEKPRTELVDSLISEYCFDEALTILNEDTQLATEAGYPTEALEKLTDKVIAAKNKLEATEKIIVVDSVVINKSDLLKTIAIDQSCGDILTPQECQKVLGLKYMPAGVGYINAFRDFIIFTKAGKGGAVSLMRSNLYGNKWTDPMPLAGLEDNSAQQGFPYLLSDGTTLYFASKSELSLGGYDIYQTRYNNETKSYLKPQNVGFPYNSPYDDYLMVFDEVNNIGWFVSNRYQPKDKVCVYIFLPSQVRQTYAGSDIETLREFAALRSIKNTQKGHEKDIAEAIERLKGIGKIKTAGAPEYSLQLEISNGVIYKSLDQFRNKQAREMATELIIQQNKFKNMGDMLNSARREYETSQSATEKKTLTTIILQREKEHEQLRKMIFDMENKIRQAETKK